MKKMTKIVMIMRGTVIITTSITVLVATDRKDAEMLGEVGGCADIANDWEGGNKEISFGLL